MIVTPVIVTVTARGGPLDIETMSGNPIGHMIIMISLTWIGMDGITGHVIMIKSMM